MIGESTAVKQTAVSVVVYHLGKETSFKVGSLGLRFQSNTGVSGAVTSPTQNAQYQVASLEPLPVKITKVCLMLAMS